MFAGSIVALTGNMATILSPNGSLGSWAGSVAKFFDGAVIIAYFVM